MRPLSQSLSQLILIFFSVLALGTVGYLLIESDWSVVDAVYMTLITLTTVGFGEVKPLSTGGRIFTMFLMIVGISGFAYGFSIITEYLFSTSIRDLARSRRMMRDIESLKDHFIICGYGRVGETAAETVLGNSKTRVVVVDSNIEQIETLREANIWSIAGDATKDEILVQAGIDRAKGLLVCTGNDSDNLFIVLSARALNPDLYIVCRSTNIVNESKMLRAGANKVISPYRIGGQRMASMLVKPNVADFMDVVTIDSGLELWLEELTIRPDSFFVGKTVIEANLRQRIGVTMVALRRADQQVFSPDGNMRFEANDHLILLGTREQLEQMEKLAES